jgi:steroid delta-isomerase-like uncharacterized protein
MNIQTNEMLVRRYYEDALTPGDWTVLTTLVADEFVDHERLFNIPPTRDGLQQKYELLRTGFPDLRFVVEDVFSAATQVAARVTVMGTHTEPFLGRPASGRPFAVTTVGIFRVAAGQLVEHWGVFDQLSMLTQLGALPGNA